MSEITAYWRVWAKKATYALVVVASLAGSYAWVSTWQRGQGVTFYGPRPPAGARIVNQTTSPVNPFASANGKHLIAYVVTASDCGWSRLPAGMEAIRKLRAKMHDYHGKSYAQVSVVAVDIDEDLNAGWKFLGELGNGHPSDAFDQVIVGGSWLNEQIVRFVWREQIARPATPQVVLIERPVSTDTYVATSTIGVGDDTLVGAFAGANQITGWMKQGMPLDHAQETAAATRVPRAERSSEGGDI